MTTANVFVKVGTTMARVQPVRAVLVKHQLEQASKVPTVKQARAAALRGGVHRSYPKHGDGMSTADYVREYYARNRPSFAGTTRHLDGTAEGYRRVAETEHRSAVAKKYADEVVAAFFEPLSANPQFAQSGDVIEEVIA